MILDQMLHIIATMNFEAKLAQISKYYDSVISQYSAVVGVQENRDRILSVASLGEHVIKEQY